MLFISTIQKFFNKKEKYTRSDKPLSRYVLRTPRPSSAPIWLTLLGALIFILMYTSTTHNFPLELAPEFNASDTVKLVQQIQAILLSFAGSMLFILVSDRISKYISERQFAVPFESINENVNAGVDQILREYDKRLTCTLVGTPDQALEYTRRKLPHTSRVMDTMISHKISEEIDRTLYYRKDNLEEFKENDMKGCIARGCMWIDIFSKGHEWKIDSVALWAEEDQNRQYQCFTLDNNMPTINFVVMHYKDDDLDKSEVLFGWGHFDHYLLAPVFKSEDEELVGFFERYFTSLLEISTPYKPQRGS